MSEPRRFTEKDRYRVAVLTHLVADRLSLPEAARRLDLSERQVRRLVVTFAGSGAEGLLHGNRGRRPANATLAETAADVVRLATTTYKGFNHEQLTEMLFGEHAIEISRPTTRRILAAEGIRPPRQRRRPEHRTRRTRRSQAGQMIQMDGSDHAWLEDRGPKINLIAGIDDASGWPWGVFRDEEDTQGYFELLRAITKTHGIPHAVYTDRDGIFQSNHDRFRIRDPMLDKMKPTQFGRLLAELGIELIRAHSPQAKGRIERFFDTTQDRLVSLLRLRDARTLADANRVLPEYLRDHSKRFTIPPANPEPAWLPWPETLDREETFCIKDERTLTRDHTFSIDGDIHRVAPDPSHARRPGTRLAIHRHFDGTIAVFHGPHRVGSFPVAEPPPIPAPAPRQATGDPDPFG